MEGYNDTRWTTVFRSWTVCRFSGTGICTCLQCRKHCRHAGQRRALSAYGMLAYRFPLDSADLAASCRKNRMQHRSDSAAVRHCIRYGLLDSDAALSKPSAQAAKHRHCTGLQSKGHYSQLNAAPTFRSCGNLPIGTRNRFLYRFWWTRSR